MSNAGTTTPAGADLAFVRWLRVRGSSAGILVFAIAAGIATGALAAQGYVEIAIAVAVGFLGWAAIAHLSVATWVVLMLVAAVATRGLVTAFGLPQAFDFAHYPLVAGLGIAALQRPARQESRGPAAWLIGLVVLCAVSALANLTHPLRVLLFLMIVSEPLVIVWALCRFRIDDRERRLIGVCVIVLAAIQIPIAVTQLARFGLGDPVQGTLAGHGAGAHVLGALFALGLLVTTAAMSARIVSIRFALVAGGTSLAMMLMTGSMAITVLTALVLPLVPLLGRAVPAGRTSGRTVMAVGVGIALAAVALSVAGALVSSLYERAERLITSEEFPEIRMVSDRSRDPGLLMFGSGPGTSASRASILLINAEEQGSPLASLQLDPTDEAIEIASSTRAAGGGTAESARSSALAIIGDLGVLGFAGLALLFVAIWRGVARSSDGLAPAVRAALVLISALIFVDSWLEYPELAVPLAILIGLVLSRGPGDDRAVDGRPAIGRTGRQPGDAPRRAAVMM